MSNVVVGNPTHRAKAVRIAGGHAIIEPGKSEALTLMLSAEEVARYEAAGLTFKAAKEDAKAEEAAPAAAPAPPPPAKK